MVALNKNKKVESKSLSDIMDFLINEVYKFLQWKVSAITMDTKNLPEDYYTYDLEYMDRVIDIIKPLLKTAQQTRKVEVETAKDIVDMIRKGKLTVDEAMKFLTLTKMKLEVEEKELKVGVQKTLLGVFTDNKKEIE